ncbi:MAG: methyltransferase domain-containing protein [Oscillospiraceae bacterium]|nr:methyltransferase domain-containing protein [Oscillospiraceae bacterium]
MEDNLLFDLDCNNYDAMRPKYHKDMYVDIKKYCHGKKALEVGMGTGQATEPFLRAAYTVTGIEPGYNMYNKAIVNFLGYKKFDCVNTTFENFVAEHDTYDIIFSATAFHWINPEIAYPKAYYLLNKGGTLALFWNTPDVNRSNDSVHYAIGDIYKKYFGERPQRPDMNYIYETRLSYMHKYGFEDVHFKLYDDIRRMNSIEYARLLETYPDVIKMERKNEFLAEIVNAIERNGGTVTIYDTIDLYLGRK